MIYPSVSGLDTGLASHVFLTITNPATGSVVRARSATGVVEDAASTGTYYLAGGYAASVGLCVYDLDGDLIGAETLTSVSPLAPLVLPNGGTSPTVTLGAFIKRGDNEPIIYPVTELDADGNQVVINVSGWTGKFKMRDTVDQGSGGGTLLINHDFYICDADGNLTTDGSLGLLAFKPVNTGGRTDTMTAGVYKAEFECIRADGSKKTYPTTSDTSKEYIPVTIIPDLDDHGSS